MPGTPSSPSGALRLPFLEPNTLRVPPRDLDMWQWPGAGVAPPSSWKELYRGFSEANLLRFVDGPVPEVEICQVFNMYKRPHRDRMIVDRRGVNGLEGRLVGFAASAVPGLPHALLGPFCVLWTA